MSSTTFVPQLFSVGIKDFTGDFIEKLGVSATLYFDKNVKNTLEFINSLTTVSGNILVSTKNLNPSEYLISFDGKFVNVNEENPITYDSIIKISAICIFKK